MKKIFLFALLALLPVTAMAQGIIDPLNSGEMASPITQPNQLYNLLVMIVKWVYTVFFILAVLFILIAAYNFIIGGQNEKKIEVAKTQLKWAVVAIAVALVASGASLIVKSFLENPQGTGGSSQAAPADPQSPQYLD